MLSFKCSGFQLFKVINEVLRVEGQLDCELEFTNDKIVMTLPNGIVHELDGNLNILI